MKCKKKQDKQHKNGLYMNAQEREVHEDRKRGMFLQRNPSFKGIPRPKKSMTRLTTAAPSVVTVFLCNTSVRIYFNGKIDKSFLSGVDSNLRVKHNDTIDYSMSLEARLLINLFLKSRNTNASNSS